MFFNLSKLLTHVTRPGDLLLLLLAVGVLLIRVQRFKRFQSAGLGIVTCVTVLFLAIGFLPLARWVTAPLENRFPVTQLPRHVDGVIVLGGAVQVKTSYIRNMPSLNMEAERMTEFVRLAKLYPDARLVFSGGTAQYTVDPARNEAGVARLFFRQQGLDVRRVTFEAHSRDTYENVVFSKVLVQPHQGQVWLLVSSARDVPRAIGVFRRQGWPVIPVPVAYKADFSEQDFAANLHMLNDSVHEWLGLAAYRLAGRTDALLPAPAKP